LSVPVIHVNKSGGGGMVGGAYALEQPADGYTILYGGLTVLIEVPIVTANCPYTWNDFIPVARVTSGPLVLSVGKDARWNTLEEFMAEAKKNPGKLTMGIPGIGTSQHLVAALFAKEAGLDINIIPFKGDGASLTALLGTHVDSAMTGLTSLTPHLKAGSVKALASSSPERNPAEQDIPTFKEKGFSKIGILSWTGAWVRKGTPAERVKKLEDAYKEAANHKSVQTLIDKAGSTPNYAGTEELLKLVPQEYDAILSAARSAGISQK
ncbi:MAG: tripartite tricarboxylate transporter substrate binding protein, partial [Desulfobacterales bacterium]|nr:tripartite tricarboxylate transporter substrate binding protein [Desulfobacterales bacterium]